MRIEDSYRILFLLHTFSSPLVSYIYNKSKVSSKTISFDKLRLLPTTNPGSRG